MHCSWAGLCVTAWAEVVGEYFGRVSVRTLDALTAWDDGLFPADGRYGRYKDCTMIFL